MDKKIEIKIKKLVQDGFNEYFGIGNEVVTREDIVRRFEDMVRKYVEEVLDTTIRECAHGLIGIDHRWDEIEVKFDSPLSKHIEDRALETAKNSFSKYLDPESFVLTAKEQKGLRSAYREELLEALHVLAVEQGRRDAGEYAEKLFDVMISEVVDEDCTE